MTGIKVALYASGITGGFSSFLTGVILANVETVTNSTPVALGLVTAGLGTAIVLAWKISRAWYQMESTVARLDERLKALEIASR